MNQKELFWVSLTVFFTIIAWLVLDIYIVKTRPAGKPAEKSFQTIDFTIKPDVLKILKGRTP